MPCLDVMDTTKQRTSCGQRFFYVFDVFYMYVFYYKMLEKCHTHIIKQEIKMTFFVMLTYAVLNGVQFATICLAMWL